jgi:hypothetical protein
VPFGGLIAAINLLLDVPLLAAVVLTCKLFCSRDRVHASGLLASAIVAARLL